MKARLVLLALLVAGLFLTACSKTGAPPPAGQPGAQPAAAGDAAPPTEPAGTTRYHHAVDGYSLALPTDWRTYESHKGTSVAAFGPAETKGALGPMATVVVEPLAGELTVDQYFTLNQQNLSRSILHYKPVAKGEGSLAGQPARWLVSTYNNGQYALQALAWFVVYNGRGYVVSFIGEPARFAANRARFDELAASFQLDAPPAPPEPPATR